MRKSAIRIGRSKEIIASVQVCVAEELEQAAVNAIRPRFDHLVYDPARGTPVLRLVVVRQNLKFRDSIGIGINHHVITEEIVVIRSVDQE